VFSAPHLLSATEALLLAASGAFLGALLAAFSERRSSGPARAAGAIAGALVVSSLAVAPVTAWAVISDLQAADKLTAREAERIGPEEAGVDTAVIDGVAQLVPENASYALVFGDRVDPDRALVFRLWALSALLPRVAVADPESADWIVGWGVSPRDLGVTVGRVRALRPRGRSDPPVYIGEARR
jgi:hypothetical protein